MLNLAVAVIIITLSVIIINSVILRSAKKFKLI